MSSTGSSQTIATRRIDLGRVLTEAGRAFIDDILPLIVAGLVGLLLSVVTLGVLAGPLFAGLLSMVMGRRNGRKPQIGDVFSQMHRFWAFFGAALVLAILIALASITIVGGILLAAIWLYVFPLMVDRGMGLGEAMRSSREIVLRAGFWEHVVLVILLAVISALGRGPLVLLTAPFIVATIAVGYLESRDDPAAAPPAPPEETTPIAG
jgi:MFS family permease